MASPVLVEHSIPCARCRFDLRATAVEGVCPECALPVVMSRGLRVAGRELVVRSGAVLPPRCIKTNVPVSTEPVTRTLYWMHPGWFVTVLLGVIVLLIVYLIVRKKCQLTYFISPEAKRRALVRQVVALTVFLGGIVCFVGGAVNDVGLLMLVGALAFLTGLILVAMFSSVLGIGGTRNGEFGIKGCGAAFLDSIRAMPPTAR